MIDFHSHLMPGVDDGAADIDEARSGLAVMREHGITTIITTPHIQASLTDKPRELDRYMGLLDTAFDALSTLAATEFPDLRVERRWRRFLRHPGGGASRTRGALAAPALIARERPSG